MGEIKEREGEREGESIVAKFGCDNVHNMHPNLVATPSFLIAPILINKRMITTLCLEVSVVFKRISMCVHVFPHCNSKLKVCVNSGTFNWNMG